MKLSTILEKIFFVKVAEAHCDVPCGVYDPHDSQQAAHTIVKMIQKINELGPESEWDINARNNFVRMVSTKEEHARRCKEQILILWTDYFKPEHLERFPDLHDKVWQAAKLVSHNKQHIDLESAQELVKAVDEIASIFHETKKA